MKIWRTTYQWHPLGAMNEKAQIYLQSINYGKNVFMALPDQNEGHLPQDPGTPACEEGEDLAREEVRRQAPELQRHEERLNALDDQRFGR